MRALRWFLPIAFASIFSASSGAYACSCFGPGAVCTIEMGKSTIFRGTVLESTILSDIHTIKRADGTEMQVHGNGTFKVRFVVAETFSGESSPEQVVQTSQQGSMCGFPFQVGREYIVFTYVHESELWTSRCSRTEELVPGAENEAIAWMHAFKTAPHGSEIFGSLRMPQERIQAVPATIELAGPENRTVNTDADGKYAARNLKPGEYLLTPHLPEGFATRSPTKITVADKGCQEIVWPVTYEGRIRGRVVDVNGKPIADLRMEVESASGDRMNSPHMATTGLNGFYEFQHLSPGDYVVAAQHPGFLVEEGASTVFYPHAERPQAQILSLGAAATVDRIDFVLARLRPTPMVRVTVTLPDGSPALAGLFLYAFPNGSSGGEPTRTGVTDATGTAVLPLALGREYAISVARDGMHQNCGFATFTFSNDHMADTLVMKHPEACSR